jgi:hypothetical protein
MPIKVTSKISKRRQLNPKADSVPDPRPIRFLSKPSAALSPKPKLLQMRSFDPLQPKLARFIPKLQQKLRNMQKIQLQVIFSMQSMQQPNLQFLCHHARLLNQLHLL